MVSSNTITVRAKGEFLDYLRSQDTTVPAPKEGRTTQHRERYEVFRLLATLATADRFAYPLTLIHQDRPDFVLQFPARAVGLEFTEAVSQEEAALFAQAQHMGKSARFFEDQFKKDMPTRTAKERRQIIENPPRGGPGWGDDRGVPQWADWIMIFIKKKTGDLAKPHFDKYTENWLLVYDDLPMSSAQNTPDRWGALNTVLGRYFAEKVHYDTVFVHSENELAESAPTVWRTQPISDLRNPGESSTVDELLLGLE